RRAPVGVVGRPDAAAAAVAAVAAQGRRAAPDLARGHVGVDDGGRVAVGVAVDVGALLGGRVVARAAAGLGAGVVHEAVDVLGPVAERRVAGYRLGVAVHAVEAVVQADHGVGARV